MAPRKKASRCGPGARPRHARAMATALSALIVMSISVISAIAARSVRRISGLVGVSTSTARVAGVMASSTRWGSPMST